MSGLPRLLRTKTTSFSSFCTKWDTILRSPQVAPFFMGSTLGLAMLAQISASVGDGPVKESPFLWRNVQMEEYKAKHGHYPH